MVEAGKQSITLTNVKGINRVYVKTISGLTLNNFALKIMLRDADIEDDTFEPYVEDVQTQLNTLKGIEVINFRDSKTTSTTNTTYYQYTAKKKCLMNITFNACHGESRAKSADILQNGVSIAGILNHDGGTVSTSASLLLNKGDVVKCNANYLGQGNNLISVHGYVQYLE